MAVADDALPRVVEGQELSSPPTLHSVASLAKEQDKAREQSQEEADRSSLGWRYRFNNPLQVKSRHYWIVRILGRVGWCAKGLVYGLLGGLSCNSAVGDSDDSVSPQGAFILVGSNTIGVPLLVVMAVALITYCIWRFWEAFTGQGADAAFGNLKNFFRYRLSPFVSGIVYALYTVFVITLIPKSNEDRRGSGSSNFPDSWTTSTAGKVGLCFAGIAFLAATLVQLEGTFTRNFHETLRPGMPSWLKWITWITGHIGFFARAGVFCCVAVLFFRAVRDRNATQHKNAIGDALEQLKSTKGGSAVLFILGVGLIVYSLFAVLNGFYVREFPTRVPSGVPHGQRTPMARAVTTMMTKASFRRRQNGAASTLPSENGSTADLNNLESDRATGFNEDKDVEMGIQHPASNGHAIENGGSGASANESLPDRNVHL